MTALTPSPEEDFPPVLPVGNDFVSLPNIDPATGTILDLYVVSERAAGLVGLRGKDAPLLRVVARDPAGIVLPFAVDSATRESAWTPALSGRFGGVPASVRVVTPPVQRGFVIMVDTAPGLEVGLEVHWEETVLAVFHTRALPARLQMRWDAWTASLCGEALGALPLIGWALAAEEKLESCDLQPTPEGGWRATLLCRAGRDGRCTFLVAVAPEEDGARTTAVHLRRRGGEALLDESRRWLLEHRVSLVDSALEERANLNLLFNRFFACGLTIDGERPCAVTSRSPRYYVSGAFWARDALLWSLPGLCRHDPVWAGALLRRILRSTWPQGAEHALYLNGTRLYPGFELDQLCAYPIAIHMVREMAPESLGDDPVADDVLQHFPEVLLGHLSEDVGLYRTFLDPSDDPPPHPFLTYDNVLAWRALEICAAARRRGARSIAGRRADPKKMARSLRAAIRRHCVARAAFGPMYAWATDGRGRHTLSDNPAGSLLTLPYHDFCRPSDLVWRTTARWIFSRENSFFVEGPFAAPANTHAPHPWPMAACHLIFCGRIEQGLGFLRRTPLDSGIACETVDVATGGVRTGGAFASFAGYLGAALYQALRPPAPAGRGRGRASAAVPPTVWKHA